MSSKIARAFPVFKYEDVHMYISAIIMKPEALLAQRDRWPKCQPVNIKNTWAVEMPLHAIRPSIKENNGQETQKNTIILEMSNKVV